MWMPRTALCRSRWSRRLTGTCPAPYVCDLQSRMARQVPRMPWHPVPRRAALVVLAVQAILTCSWRIGAVTCGWLIKLRSAYILGYFIRNRRFALIVYSGFTRGEYHVIRVDFIVALRRTKGRRRRTLRSPSPPSSGLHLLTPGCPLWRGILAAAVDRDIVSLYPVQTVCRHFDVSFGCFVFGLRSLAFQSISLGFGRTFFIIGWKKDAVRMAL